MDNKTCQHILYVQVLCFLSVKYPNAVTSAATVNEYQPACLVAVHCSLWTLLCHAFVSVNISDNYSYFPLVDPDSFCLSVSKTSPRMQLCVRRWKFWIVQFWTWWLMCVCGLWEKGQSLTWVHEILCQTFFKLFGKEVICLKRLNCLTYIWADRGEPGEEPIEIFICSPSCLLPGCIVISSCRFEGLNSARLLIKKNVWLH